MKVAKFIYESAYWNQTSPYYEEYDEFWAELVPDSGESETLQGEILRSFGRIMWDYYNNGFGNDKTPEALFLEKYSNKFKPFMKNPPVWDKFFNEYQDIHFGNYDELWKEAEQEAEESNSMSYGRGYGFEDDEDDYEDYEETADDYFVDIPTRMKQSGWEQTIDNQMDEIMDGIIKYIRQTYDKLEPLPQGN